jgi:hypothetical protein
LKYLDYIFVLAVGLLIVSVPDVAECYGRNVYPAIAAVSSRISGIFPFSLFDVFITLLILLIPASIILPATRVIALKKMLTILFFVIFGTISWFYLSWGINYFRHDVYRRTGTVQAQFDTTEFKIFLDKYVEDINAACISVDKIDLQKVDKAIENAYSTMAERLQITYPCGKRRTKRMIYQSIMTKMGVSGYFGPFFNEVHVNFYPEPLDIPYTLAHEKAHQFGVASEAECNLYAFVACVASEMPEVRYSGYLGAFGYVFSYARRLMPNEFKNCIERLDKRILSDYKRSLERWQDGINQELSDAQSKVYNAYLKTNRIESGIKNYSEMLGLLVSWRKEN